MTRGYRLHRIDRAPKTPARYARPGMPAEGSGLLGARLGDGAVLAAGALPSARGLVAVLPNDSADRLRDNMERLRKTVSRWFETNEATGGDLFWLPRGGPTPLPDHDAWAALPLHIQVLPGAHDRFSEIYLQPEKRRFVLRQAPGITPRRQSGGPLRVSSRVLNPLGHDDDPTATFCDANQAKATTATRFFRNPCLFRALREAVVPAHLARGAERNLGVWSAGCSTGEEVYSLAMAGAEALRERKQPLRLTVFGTDISPDCLRTARIGEYRHTPGTYVATGYEDAFARYGEIAGGRWRAGEALRRAVRLGRFDLRQRPTKHTFQFIVCNHVLQYYQPAAQQTILANLKAVLCLGGFLYIEGITPDAREQAGLTPVAGFRNLYVPAG